MARQGKHPLQNYMDRKAKEQKRQIVIDWRPQERQLQFLRSAGLATLWGYADPPIADEILYGGAAKPLAA
jgi:hypothetical protein